MTHVVGLRLTNYLRFRGTFELALGPGTYAVTAEDEGDAGRSNWLGKSALLGALRYALEGHKPKQYASLDDLISWGEDRMAVEVELSDGTFVSREKKRGKATDLCVETTDGDASLVLYKDQAEAQIWFRLGLSAEDLESTAYAEQRKLAALVAADSDVDLTSLVNGWLNLQPLERAADRAGAALRAASVKLKLGEQELRSLEARIATEDESSLVAELERLKAEAADYDLRRKNQEQRLRERDAWLHTKQRREAAEEVAAEVTRLEQQLADLPVPEGDEDALALAAFEANTLVGKTADEHRQKLKLAAGQFSGACPVNGEACPVTAKINGQRKLNAQLVEAAWAAKIQAEGAAVIPKQRLADFQSAARDRARVEARLEQARAAAAANAHLLQQPLPFEPSVEALIGGSTVAGGVRELQQRLDQLRSNITLRDALTTTLVAFRLQVARARAAFAVLGPDGAQRRIAERAVQDVERTANRDLAQAGIALTVCASWGRETQKPAEQCPQCGGAFPRTTTVKTCETCLAPRGLKVVPDLRFKLSHVSGAADDLGGFGVRCGAFKWLRSRRGAQWSVAVLDEPFSQLDATHKRAFAAQLQRLLSGTFEQAFVTAHDRQLLDSFPRRILITGRGAWSEVKVVG